MICALSVLYRVTGKPEYLLAAEKAQQFADVKGGYFLYGNKNSSLITKPKETYDGWWNLAALFRTCTKCFHSGILYRTGTCPCVGRCDFLDYVCAVSQRSAGE